MPHTEPAAHASHDRWTPVPGTAFEVYQAGGTNISVYLLATDPPEIAWV